MQRFVVMGAIASLLGAGVAGAEIPASGVASFEALDLDHNGELDFEESKAIATVGETFDDTDSNRDGWIDRVEFEGVVSGTTGTQVGYDEEEEAE